jgi:hypothetical protein
VDRVRRSGGRGDVGRLSLAGAVTATGGPARWRPASLSLVAGTWPDPGIESGGLARATPRGSVFAGVCLAL